MGKLSRRPGTEIDAFIEGADEEKPPQAVKVSPPKKTPSKIPSASYPWEDPHLRADVTKTFNLRLPEAYLYKLRFIAENTPYSGQRFLLETVLPAIDAKIEELTKKGK